MTDKWYPGKYLDKAIEGVKYAGRAAAKRPGAAILGGVGGFVVGGPVGAVVGAGAVASAVDANMEKEVKDGDAGDADKEGAGRGEDKTLPEG